MKNVSAEVLDEIVKRVTDALHPVVIYLFGSQVHGDVGKDSDIDLLAVVQDTNRSTREIAIEGREGLWDLNVPVDLVVCTESEFSKWRDVKNNVINEASCFGRIVYGS
jgi:predicted nucleotidyltransferase